MVRRSCPPSTQPTASTSGSRSLPLPVLTPTNRYDVQSVRRRTVQVCALSHSIVAEPLHVNRSLDTDMGASDKRMHRHGDGDRRFVTRTIGAETIVVPVAGSVGDL